MATALGLTQPALSCTDHELIVAVRRGSDRAFEELYGRYRGRIGSYVFGMVGDHARAEDIAQEVFISALRRLRDTERPIAFKPWLYEIAKNACIDEFRRTRRMREIPLERDTQDTEAEPLQLAGSATPDSEVENRQRLRDLRGAFYGLSQSHHRIIVMRELEGLSYDQIGERLGMSRPMVESTLFRARKRLGEEYHELVSGRRCERIQTMIAAGDERPLSSLGIREKRQLARHLAHCQPCRRHARMAGVDESFFQTPGLIGKIAALLPIPWLRSRRSHESSDTAGGVGGHQLLALQSLQAVAPLAEPSGSSSGLGRAAAAVAALAIAGAGGGIVSGIGGHERQSRVPRPGAAHPVGGRAAQVARARLGQTRSSTTSVTTGGGGGSPGASGAAGGGAGAGPGGGAGAGARSSAPGATRHATAPGSSPARAGAPSSSTTSPVGSVLQAAQGTVGAVTGSGSAVGNATNTATQLVNGTTSTVTKLTGGVLPPILPGPNTSQLPQLPPVPQPQVPPLPQPQLPPLNPPPLPPLPQPKLPAPKLPAPKLPPLPQPKLPAPKLPSLPSAPAPQVPSVPTPPLPSVSTPKLPSASTPSAPQVQVPQVAPTATQSPASVLPPLGIAGH